MQRESPPMQLANATHACPDAKFMKRTCHARSNFKSSNVVNKQRLWNSGGLAFDSISHHVIIFGYVSRRCRRCRNFVGTAQCPKVKPKRVAMSTSLQAAAVAHLGCGVGVARTSTGYTLQEQTLKREEKEATAYLVKIQKGAQGKRKNQGLAISCISYVMDTARTGFQNTCPCNRQSDRH